MFATPQHIKESGLDFDLKLANRHMHCLTKAIYAGIWGGLCPEWFVDDKNKPLQRHEGVLLEVVPVSSKSSQPFNAMFEMRFSNGSKSNVHLHKQSVCKSFYSNEEIYSIAKQPTCVIHDIVLAKGGPESIVESYYSAMRYQQQTGGQADETLTQRTKLSWCLPSLKECDAIIAESVKLYHKGDGQFRANRSKFFSERAHNYNVSKVVDRC